MAREIGLSDPGAVKRLLEPVRIHFVTFINCYIDNFCQMIYVGRGNDKGMMHMPRGTPSSAEPPTIAEPEPEGGCAFVFDRESRAATGQTCCAAPRRLGSVYCPEHHAVCYLPSESLAERRKLKEIEALAEAVGGRSGRPTGQPSPRFLRRMDRISRAALRPKCSRVVLEDRDNRGGNR
ncbi:MAG: hypothetical protein AB7H90_11500 [Alphaproteobacteria bacterium]